MGLTVGVLVTLGLVLAAAAVSKLVRRPVLAPASFGSRVPARLVALVELAGALSVLAAPGRASGVVLAGFFSAFAAAHARSWYRGESDDCGCFGSTGGRGSTIRRLALTAGSALAAGGAAV